jgi:SpoVK/Ycf46/Vps4 family AAA+-type ATPase
MQKSKRRKQIKFETAPPINSLKDLILLGSSLKYYRNIDNVSLWKITPHLEELEKMIGMEGLKETVLYQILYYLQGMHIKCDEYLHTVIYGPPGSGKTTVAKILGNIYKELGILSENSTFKVARREDFVAGYLGQTAGKTKKFLDSCLGGVLFIDEAYSLTPRNNDKDSFSKEAIDTLNSFLSENKKNFCCIIAGYENEIKECFFNMNRGLERRFPWIHRIGDYTCENLSEIFLKMVREIDWNISFTKNFITLNISKHKDIFKNGGGDIETFLTKCKIFHSKRVFNLDRKEKFIISEKDFNEALKYIEKNKPIEDKPPEHMYL